MLSRVAAVKAPRTHIRRRVTGSSGKRREGRESEQQRPNMSRRVFTSAVLLLLVVMMCCGTGVAAEAAGQPSQKKFEWKFITEGETVESLGAPGLLKVGSDIFAVAEAQCKKGEDIIFTGIASQLLTETEDVEQKEVMKDAKKKTQFLEKEGSERNKVDVSRPTIVVKENDIYMMAGTYSSNPADGCQDGADVATLKLLLVKGQVSDGENKKIDWNDAHALPCTFLNQEHKSWTRLTGGGGSGVTMEDGTLVFPVEGARKVKKEGDAEKDEKTVSLITSTPKDTNTWKLSKGTSDGGCSDPSVVEWGEDKKLIMMTACDDGRRRVYESGDKGESWTEALGTLSRVWGNKQGESGVRSGFITATIGDGDKKKVMLVTLPVYAKKINGKGEKEKSELHLWLTDNTHIVDIGSVSDDDVAASSLLYKSGESETNNEENKEELIALYEKKGDGKPSHSLWSVVLTEQLQRVKEVLATWKKVDDLFSKLCPPSSDAKDPSTGAARRDFKVTDGLVGFLSDNFSENTWRDEYLGVNATVKNNGVGGNKATKTSDGVKFHGAWVEWPVGSQGENQLYHFANYNFTLVATVSIHGEPKEGTIPVMGAKMNDAGNSILFGLSYDNKEKKWQLLCGGGNPNELSSTSEKTHHVVILLRNSSQGSAYVDGKQVGGDVPCALGNTDSKGISHFYIGGSAVSAGSKGDVSVTVTNVLLYNRPLSSEEVGALSPNKDSIQLLEENPSEPSTVSSDSVVPPIPLVTAAAQKTGTLSTPAGTQLTEQGQPMGSSGAGSGGASTTAVSTVSTSSAEEESVLQVTSGTSPDGTQSVGGGSTAVGEPTMETREGGTNGQEEEVNTQVREVNATALSSNLGNVSQGNNTDAGKMRGSGLLPSLLLLLGLWVFAAL
ncbi:putative trans-sialidase, Group V [Trypanosoma cruzi]|uniref:Trans-sialidase, putative n=2 Tax=Trypanosoma cruzi TaxID=5693 RepID=Q4DN89_TRYCC|nr:trans-sialidase, putative [Trypanosoma cruzi]EAN93991.1 trans-sialidase, putative [Trypanosoma cruzi]PWV10632.1 putative trans-sialidase, Group V [Trypanosoma cruzi]RNC36230.1 putative trans-sialidase [Trypanosoma cruzi]|eukprot:XP_815842.1 trans-sialidase [Trypanosoma cruzi strain CL Brener]